MLTDPTRIQRAYYAATADRYDTIHGNEDDEHGLALQFLIAAIDYFEIKSILDIGSGTGRSLLKIKMAHPHISVLGIEPSSELRKVGHAKGLSQAELIDGDAMKLAFGDNSFDMVCEFAALHHIPKPALAVSEMLRVARQGVFISDSNNFGQGTRVSRMIKQGINALGLWPLANLIKTGGKGYTITEGDGLSYSYSVFNDYDQVASRCMTVHLFNTGVGSPNLYRTAPHVAILGIKKPCK